MDPRLARCHLLAEILSADGIMEERERRVLEDAMSAAGLSDDERDRVRHFEGTEGAAAALAALGEDARQEILDELVAAALVDGRLTSNETAAVKRLAAALGLG